MRQEYGMQDAGEGCRHVSAGCLTVAAAVDTAFHAMADEIEDQALYEFTVMPAAFQLGVGHHEDHLKEEGVLPDVPEMGLHQLANDERSEQHTSELQSLLRNSYAVFYLKKKQ